MIYLTGDTHRDFDRVERFCLNHNTSKADIMIILGDAGINYYGGKSDRRLKQKLSELPISFLCIRGNHEMDPCDIESYKMVAVKHEVSDRNASWRGCFYREEEFPSLLFAMDGYEYGIGEWNALVLGGAYSVDKDFRAEWHPSWSALTGEKPWPEDWNDKDEEWKERQYYLSARGAWWFPNEQMNFCQRQRVMEQLRDDASYGEEYLPTLVLSHTVPYRHVPREKFIPGVDQSKVDNTMEYWMNDVQEELLPGTPWYAGHWHVDKIDGPVRLMYTDIIELPRKKAFQGAGE